MTYPDTSIAHPTDIARQADAPWHSGDVQFNLRGLIDTSILIRPLSRHVYASRWTHDGKATAIVADIAVLEDQNHAASLHSQVTVSQPNVVKTLCAVLDSPQVFTVAGVVSTIGDGERRALVLSPLPEALVPAEPPWKSRRLLTLETRMQVCRRNSLLGSPRRVATAWRR
ncbi:hypothetical protein, partial [Mycobacteroides abscessus]|uniref:hypothetical protein n=1 Tax=Mycobacteroides abscessus TaxID=36809 RepID=UPI001A9A1A36